MDYRYHSHNLPRPRSQDASWINKPITYSEGPNAGKTIRAAIEEYQQPDLGRKFAKRDRRPLDPPPVVRLRMWEVYNVGTAHQSEHELAADDVEVQGLVGHIDLFRVNPDTHTIAVENATEVASLTRHTFGSSFVHATHILDLEGKPAIIFVFADLSIRLEGAFALRYRIFDLVSRVAGSDAIPVAAELYGGVFTVYSTKEFPGLQASTALTKHLGRWGIRVNLREGERKRKSGGHGSDDDDDDDEGGGPGEDEVEDVPKEEPIQSPGKGKNKKPASGTAKVPKPSSKSKAGAKGKSRGRSSSDAGTGAIDAEANSSSFAGPSFVNPTTDSIAGHQPQYTIDPRQQQQPQQQQQPHPGAYPFIPGSNPNNKTGTEQMGNGDHPLALPPSQTQRQQPQQTQTVPNRNEWTGSVNWSRAPMGPPAQPAAVWNQQPVPQRSTTVPDWSRPEKHVLEPNAAETVPPQRIPGEQPPPQQQQPTKPPSKPRKRARVSASGPALIQASFEDTASPTTGAATAATAALTLNTNSPQPGYMHPQAYAPSPSHQQRPPPSFTFPQPPAIPGSMQATPHHQPQQPHHHPQQQQQQYVLQQPHHSMQPNPGDLTSQPQQYPVTNQPGAMYGYRNTR